MNLTKVNFDQIISFSVQQIRLKLKYTYLNVSFVCMWLVGIISSREEEKPIPHTQGGLKFREERMKIKSHSLQEIITCNMLKYKQMLH